MLCVQRNRKFRRVGFQTPHRCILAYLHAFLSVPECFKRPDKLILHGLVLVLELAAQEEENAGGSRVMLPKDVKPHLSTHALWAQVLSGLVGFTAVFSSSFHISYQGAAHRSQGGFFLLVGSQFAMGISFVCFVDRILFPCSAFLFPNCHWIFDVCRCTLMYIGRLRNLLMSHGTCLSYSAKLYQPITSIPPSMPPCLWNFIVRFYSSLCPNIYILWKSHPSALPLFLLSSSAMRQHDVNLLSPRHCVASLQIKWWWSSLGLGNSKKWKISCLPKPGRTVGAELGLEHRIRHGTACHNK